MRVQVRSVCPQASVKKGFASTCVLRQTVKLCVHQRSRGRRRGGRWCSVQGGVCGASRHPGASRTGQRTFLVRMLLTRAPPSPPRLVGLRCGVGACATSAPVRLHAIHITRLRRQDAGLGGCWPSLAPPALESPPCCMGGRLLHAWERTPARTQRPSLPCSSVCLGPPSSCRVYRGRSGAEGGPHLGSEMQPRAGCAG